MIKKCVSCDFRTDELNVEDCPGCSKPLVPSLLESVEMGELVELTAPPLPAPVARTYLPYPSGTPQGLWESLSDSGLGWVFLFILVILAGLVSSSWVFSA